MFNSKEQIAQLTAENNYLRMCLSQANAMEATTLAQETIRLRNDISAARAELQRVQAQARVEAESIVEIRDIALLQEAGIYDYHHPLADAVAYKEALARAKAIIKQWISSGHAVSATTTWTVNGSARDGSKMVADFSKLMLRAYNAEADNAVRSLRPYALDAAKKRLTKVRDTVARLGKSMDIQISGGYHDVRLYELDLTADYLVKKEAEKEAVRAQREEEREQARANKELAAERVRLEKEHSHYETAIARLLADGQHEQAAQLQTKLDEINDAISGVDFRAANIRAGYVYVISNIGAFGDGIVKVGMTRRLEPMDRVRELGDASVPFRFDVHALVFSKDAVGLETALHQSLADRAVNQVNTRREFFYATPGLVKELLAEIDGQALLEYTDTAEALEWRSSGGAHRRSQLTATPPPAIADDTATFGAPAPATAPVATAAPPVGTGVAQADTSAPQQPPAEPNPLSAPGHAPADTDTATTYAPGWYRDPNGGTGHRWWDGHTWTAHTWTAHTS